MDLIYWSVRSSSKMGGDGVKRLDGRDIVIYPAASITLLVHGHLAVATSK